MSKCKGLKLALVLLVLLASFCSAMLAQNPVSVFKQHFFTPTLYGRFDVGTILSRVGYGPLPLSIRQVPHHPDDPNYQFTLPASTMYSKLLFGNVAAMPGIILGGRVGIRGGPLWQAFGDGGRPNGSFQRINQRGADERGYGTSLVWLRSQLKRTATTGYIGEAEIFLHQKLEQPRIGVVGGYAVSHFNYTVDRGYDRYDSLQFLDNKLFSQNQASHLYFGICLSAPPSEVPVDARFYATAGPAIVKVVPIPEFSLPGYQQKAWMIRFGFALGLTRPAKKL